MPDTLGYSEGNVFPEETSFPSCLCALVQGSVLQLTSHRVECLREQLTATTYEMARSCCGPCSRQGKVHAQQVNAY